MYKEPQSPAASAHHRFCRLFVLMSVLIITAVVAFINRGFLVSELNEAGDFAANSLLIQDAKHLRLLTGHYSRLGFNHPGPVVLYVLALGEYLLFDLTGLVGSPFAGQLVAVGFLSGCWLTMVAVLLFRILRSFIMTTVMLSVFLLFIALNDYHAIVGIWFAHLLVLPFAAFTLAVAGLILGRSDCITVLALSGGFLVHGHTSFVPVTGLMVVGALLFNYLLSRGDPQFSPPRVISASFISANRRRLLFTVLIALLFLLPIVLETLLHFPGPIQKYLSFSQGNRNHGFYDAAKFVGFYWGGGAISLFYGMLILAGAWPRGPAANRQAAGYEINALICALLLATLALLFYAMVGIDDLNFTYLALFYFAVPAFALGLLLSEFTNLLPEFWKKPATLAFAIIAAVGTTSQITKPPGYSAFYHNASISRVYEGMKNLGTETAVFNLDNTANWEPLWSLIAGVEVYAKRRNQQLFCINKNWHILFTESGRCTEEQLAHGDRFLVTGAKWHAETPLERVFELDGITFYRYPAVLLPVGKRIRFADAKDGLLASLILGSGWSDPEDAFVWSTGPRSELFFRTQPHTDLHLIMDLEAFLPKPDFRQEVEILISGTSVARLSFSRHNRRAKHAVALPSNLIPADGMVRAVIKTLHPSSPKSVELSSDDRQLGVALYEIAIEKAE